MTSIAASTTTTRLKNINDNQQKDIHFANRRDATSNTQRAQPEFIKFDIEDAKQPSEHIRKHVEKYRERELKNQQSSPIVMVEKNHEHRSNVGNKNITKPTIVPSSAATASSSTTKVVNQRRKKSRRSVPNESRNIDRIQRREMNLEAGKDVEGDMEMMHSRHRRIYAIYPSHSRGNGYSHNHNSNPNPLTTPHFQHYPYMQLPRKSLNKLPMEVQKTISYIMKDKYHSSYPKYESGGSVKYLTLDKATAFQTQQHHLQQQPNELRKIKIVYIPQYTYTPSTPSYVQYTTPSPVVSTTLASPEKLSPLIQKTSPELSASVASEVSSTQIKLVPDINYGVIHEIPAPILYSPENDNKNNKYVSDNDLDSANSIAPQPNIQQTQSNYIKYVYKNPEKYELLRGEHVANSLDPSYSYIFSKSTGADLKPQRPQDNTAPILFHPNTTQAPDIDYSTAASTTKDYSYNGHPHKDFIPITENEETSYSSTPSSLSILPSTSETSSLAENSEEENEFYSFEENNSNVIHITPSPYPREESLEDTSLSTSPASAPLSLLSYSSEEKEETAIKPLETIQPSPQSHHTFVPSINTLVSILLLKKIFLIIVGKFIPNIISTFIHI
ncbi:hypothetical protein ACFFRR_009393 [Megaselia abdita]